MHSALHVKELHKHFHGVQAINDLSFSIEKGKVTSIIGPNGSGKTTLINVLTGVLPIDTGSVIVGGQELQTVRPYDVSTYGITRTFQNIRLFEQMTVLDNLLVVLTERAPVLALFERHGNYHLNQAHELLSRVDLWKKKDDLAINLSYGQRKLLEIARALAMRSEIYLFDEPFAGLFPEIRKIVIAVIHQLQQEGKTVILIEHDMELIRELSDHVVVLDSGKLLAQGAPEAVLKDPRVVEAYLGD